MAYDVKDRVRVARAHRGMSQVQLARAVSSDQSFICKIEGGKRDPSLKTLRRILAVLEMDEATFYSIQEPPRVKPDDHEKHLAIQSGTAATTENTADGPTADEQGDAE
jgi:transcriptional regulator with XRE-family HTH domain